MTRPLIPIFMGLLSLAASRTEPVDLADASAAARDFPDDVFFPAGNVNVPTDLNGFPGLMALVGRHRQINLDDGRSQPRDWNELDAGLETPSALTARKMFALDDADGDVIDDVDEASRSMDELDDNDLNRLSTVLLKLLRQPTWEAPLVIVGEPTFSQESEEPELKTFDDLETRPAMWKRSRYYRRYPGKRQNNRTRNGYDYDTVHLCEPSREDVFQLLVALHEVRQGNKRRLVNFCKRRRTAGTVFTSIRFLGRRK